MELNKRPSSLSLVLGPGSPTQGQDKEPCAPVTCASSGGSALGESSWTRAHWEALGSPRLDTASDCHRLAMTSSSLAGGQGALPSGAGQGCSCSSPMATCRGDAALIQKQPHTSMRLLVSSRQNFPIISLFPSLSLSPLIPPCLPLFLTHTAFANTFFISLYTPPTFLWLNLLAHPTPALQRGEI